MGWCSNCKECPIYRDPNDSYVCCTLCGRILYRHIYRPFLTFAKDSSGQSRQAGNIIKILHHDFSASNLRIVEIGIEVINRISNFLDFNGGNYIIGNAHDFYERAVDKNFTKGRKISHVAAACLYLACRQSKRDNNLLIDFSARLGIDVCVLRAVFLQLCKTLDLLEHPIVHKIVDPSFFMHRFTKRLLGKKNDTVSDNALGWVARMDRDWMQTERKPNGLCGAALYMSVHSHGLNYSKSDIASAVHIREATLNRLLAEFGYNDSGWLNNEGNCGLEGKTSKESKEPRSADSAGHESIDPFTFSEQHGFADSEGDGSDHFSFSDIDDTEERKQEEAKNMTPAQTLEATRHMLKRKTFSSKINYEALKTLFASEQDTVKKQKVETDAGDPHDTLEMKGDHVGDPNNKDDDGPGPSKNDRDEDFNNGDENEHEDEEYDYGDEDYDYGDEDYGYEDDF